VRSEAKVGQVAAEPVRVGEEQRVEGKLPRRAIENALIRPFPSIRPPQSYG
jgi:hypothetical protein